MAITKPRGQYASVEDHDAPNLRSVAAISQTFAISGHRLILRRIRELITELAPHIQTELTEDESVDLRHGGKNVGFISPVGRAPGQTSLDVVKDLTTQRVPYDMDSHEGLSSAVRSALIWLGELPSQSSA